MYQKIIIKTILTEKMAICKSDKTNMLLLFPQSLNKIQIKSAIENRVYVSVLKVATMNFKGKLKQMTTKSNGRTIRTQGRKSGFKKH